MRPFQAFILELMCLQSFHILTFGYSRWLFTSITNNDINSRVLTGIINILYKISLTVASILEIFLSQKFHTLIFVALRKLVQQKTTWLLFSAWHMHTTYTWDSSKIPPMRYCLKYITWFWNYLSWPQMTFYLRQTQKGSATR